MQIKFTSRYSGSPYTLRHVDGRYTCTCADFEYRSGPAGGTCKHIRDFASDYQIVDEPHTHVLAGTIQTLRHESFGAPSRTRTAINQVVGFLGQELAEEVLG